MAPVVMTCPTISPEWQLAAELALVKPKPYTKDKIQHATARQRWPRNARRIVDDFAAAHELTATYASRGPNRVLIDMTRVTPPRAKRLARKLSRLLPTLWFDFAGSYLRDGEFHTRRGRYRLELVKSDRPRLRRSVKYGFLGDIDDAFSSARNRNGQHTPA
jgi:hypothetical protein